MSSSSLRAKADHSLKMAFCIVAGSVAMLVGENAADVARAADVSYVQFKAATGLK